MIIKKARDLKPGDVFVEDGRCVVKIVVRADFLLGDAQEFTADQDVKITPAGLPTNYEDWEV